MAERHENEAAIGEQRLRWPGQNGHHNSAPPTDAAQVTQTLTHNQRQHQQAGPKEAMKREIGGRKANLDAVLCNDETCRPRQGCERAAHDSDDHRRPMHFFGRGHGLQEVQGKRGDFGTADTLGSPAKSNCQSTTFTSPGWKAHGEVAKSHHYLGCYRLNSYALDVP